jgi:cobalt-zinc-cadmium efflux system protein
MDVLTAHIAVNDGAASQVVLHRARTLLAEQFHLSHATLQVETADDHSCDEMTW